MGTLAGAPQARTAAGLEAGAGSSTCSAIGSPMAWAVALAASLAFGCARSDPSPAATPSPAVAALPERGEAVLRGSDSGTPPAASGLPSSHGEPPAPREPGGLPGRTIDYRYDGADVGDPSRAYEGRAFIHDAIANRRGKLALIVFLHGLNRERIPHRWMGGGSEGDVRRIVADLIDQGRVEPAVVAGPGSVIPAAVAYGASFPAFDLARFVAQTEEALPDDMPVDRARIVVAGHSGAGCSDSGGLVAAARAPVVPFAVVSIDTCMRGALAVALGRAPAMTHVVVTWQTASWSRPFDLFRATFHRETAEHPPSSGALRELDPLPALPNAHDATVGQTLAKWLPRLLPPR